MLSRVASRDDLSVEPGGDVEDGNRVVGGFVAELVGRPGGEVVALRVVDRRMSWAERVAEVSRAKGIRAVSVDPTEGECFADILTGWGEGRR